MRILMVSEDLPAPQIGGLGKHVVTLANALLADGYDVALMGRSDRCEGDAIDRIRFHGRFIPGFHFRYAAWKEAELGVFLPLKREALAKRIARAISSVARDFDVIHYHGHFPMVGRYLERTINFVQTRHDQGSECLTHLRFVHGEVCNTTIAEDCAKCIHPAPGKVRRWVSGRAVRSYRSLAAAAFAARNTIFVSEFLRRQFLHTVTRADMRNTWVVHNFIDFSRLQEYILPIGAIDPGSILLAGRIDEGKGFGEFLETARGQIPTGVRLDIIGDGPRKEPLARRYTSANVLFHGWKTNDAVIRTTARSHLCVVPSIWEEPCGTTLLEALALGRPCLALSRGGTPELKTYERYPGQLTLVATMEELVAEALARATQEVVQPPLRHGFGADVTVAMRKILSIYAREVPDVAAA